MSSIVLELQRDAMDGATKIGDLLRKSLVVATKLQLPDWIQWCQSELSGYPSGTDGPDYRQVQGELQVYNPHNGHWMQMQGAAQIFSTCCLQPVAEIEELGKGKGVLGMAAPPHIARRVVDPITPPRIIVPHSAMNRILDAVRNTILDWTLKLEMDNILGEGMTFTKEEKQIAMSNVHHYNIGTVNGVVGSVTGGNLQIGDYNQIRGQLEGMGVSKEERDGLEQLMADLATASAAERPNLVRRGIEWTVRNAGGIGQLSHALHEWFQKFQ